MDSRDNRQHRAQLVPSYSGAVAQIYSGVDKRGQPPGSKLDAHEAFILELVEQTPDISLEEIAERLLADRSVRAVPSTVCEFFKKRDITYKKRRRMRASSNART